METGEQSEASLESEGASAVREVRVAYENVKMVDCLDLSPEGNAAWEAALKRWVVRANCVCVWGGGGSGVVHLCVCVLLICVHNSLLCDP